jgi:hypothetical protein
MQLLDDVLIFSNFYCRYFKVLIQEMDLRLDLGFVYALAGLMTEAEVTEKTEVRLTVLTSDRKN